MMVDGAWPARGDLAAVLSDVQPCPVCASTGGTLAEPAPMNLYSEKLAALLGCDERALIDHVPNLACGECGVVYKSRWFKPALLHALFARSVPCHPKGWDALARRFSKQHFLSETAAFQRAVVANDRAEMARHQRGLTSIIESIEGFRESVAAAELLRLIRAHDAERLMALAACVPDVFGEPAPFRRFSGFSSSALWAWMNKWVGPIARYGEVGCPLWGQLVRAGATGVACTHFARPEVNYWGDACTMDGVHCRSALVAQASVATLDWQARRSGRCDVLGAFQYLDHLEQPVAFVAECFEAAPVLMLILDGVDQATAIQHRTGWNDRAIHWLARRFNKRVHDDFPGIRASGNRVWLLADG